MGIELLPCPFCGGEAETVEHDSTYLHGFFAHCANDDCPNTVETDIYPTEAEAIAAWNTRHEETCKVKELETIAQTLSMASWLSWGECSECGCLTPVDSTFCIHCGRKVER